MRRLYVVEIEESETEDNAIYFTEMTERQAKEMEKLLKESGAAFTLNTVTKDQGFREYDELVGHIEDTLFGEADHRDSPGYPSHSG